jgi:Tfp pilus assembly protein PilO
MNLPSLTLGAGTKAEHSVAQVSKLLVFAPSILAIITSVLIGFFVVWPKFNETIKLKESNKTLEQDAVKLSDKAVALSRLDKSKLKSQLSSAELLLPSDKNIFPFIMQIEDIRNKSGVVFTSLSVGAVGQFKNDSAKPSAVGATAGAPPPPPVPGTDADLAGSVGANVVEMKVSVTSDYRSILQFLNNLYGMARVTTVKDLSFSSSAEGQISSSLSISSLWQPLPSELPDIKSPLPALGEPETSLLARIESSGASIAPLPVPDVPKGRPDIFTKF